MLKYQREQGSPVSRPCVFRMADHCLPKIVLYGKLSTGHRDRGAPKRDLKTLSRNPCQHATLTLSCGQPLPLTEGLGVTLYTSQPPALRTFVELPSRRSEVGERSVSPQSQPGNIFPCSCCGRVCLSRIGLLSHERACIQRGQYP